MIVLPIDQSSIDNPRRIDVGRIEAVMLWPNNEASSEGAMLLARCLSERELMKEGRLPLAAIEALADAAVDARAPSDMANAAEAVFVNGIVAGYLLHSAVSAAEQQPADAAIQANVKRISESLYPRMRLRPQTINNSV